jgi:hypothetical protein
VIERMDNVGIVVDDLDAAARPWRRTPRRGGAVRGQLPALLPPRPRGHHRRTGRADPLTVLRGRPATNLHTRTAGAARDPVTWAGCRFGERPRRTSRYGTTRTCHGHIPTDEQIGGATTWRIQQSLISFVAAALRAGADSPRTEPRPAGLEIAVEQHRPRAVLGLDHLPRSGGHSRWSKLSWPNRHGLF